MVRRFATTATTGTTRMIARLTATTVPAGSTAACSWALAPGTDGVMDTAGATGVAGAMGAAATVTDAAGMDTADDLGTVDTVVALDMVRGLVTAAERGLAVVMAVERMSAAVVVDSTAVVAEASTAAAVDMAAADTGKLSA